MRKQPLVGIFDSGIGGLTVLRECMRELPDCRFLYYGDNAHVPYGSRTEAEILSFVTHAAELFLRRGADAVVLACNTATAVAAEKLRQRFPFPIVGVEPAVKLAAASCKNVLVLSTPVTAKSERLRRLIAGQKDCRFTVAALPYLAGAIEAHLTRGERLDLGGHLPKGEFDGVVLGCTHYVFLREEIGRFYAVPVFDGNRGTALRLKKLLNCPKFGTSNHHESPQKILENRLNFVNSSQNPNKCVFFKHLFP